MNDATDSKLILNSRTYDNLKDLVTIVFPALVVAYSGLGILWGWDYVEQVVASAGIVITFLGVLVKVASKKYAQVQAENPDVPAAGYDGELVVNDTDPEKDLIRLNLDRTFEELGDRQQVVLKVNNPLRDASQ